MTVTLPVSNNLRLGLLGANIPLAVGAYLLTRFGSQVDSLSSAIYTLSGPLEGLEPQSLPWCSVSAPDTTLDLIGLPPPGQILPVQFDSIIISALQRSDTRGPDDQQELASIGF